MSESPEALSRLAQQIRELADNVERGAVVLSRRDMSQNWNLRRMVLRMEFVTELTAVASTMRKPEADLLRLSGAACRITAPSEN